MSRAQALPDQRREASAEKTDMKPEGADVAFARWQAAPLIAEGRWRSAAACRSADPEVFFPISNSGKSLEQIAIAKAICAGCPVGRECLAFALRTHQIHGIWAARPRKSGLWLWPRGQANPVRNIVLLV